MAPAFFPTSLSGQRALVLSPCQPGGGPRRRSADLFSGLGHKSALFSLRSAQIKTSLARCQLKKMKEINFPAQLKLRLRVVFAKSQLGIFSKCSVTTFLQIRSLITFVIIEFPSCALVCVDGTMILNNWNQ